MRGWGKLQGRRGAGALIAAVLAVATLGTPAASAAPPVPVPCTIPQNQGLLRSQVGARYGLQTLWDAGFEGQGVVVGLVELGTAVDPQVLADYQQCLGETPTPFTSIPVGAPATLEPSNESMGDAEMVVGLAPRLDRLYEFTNGDGGALVPTLKAALDPANYGGRVPDIVSISFNQCEGDFTQAQIDDAEAALAEAAARGTWVVKGAADSGSSACAAHGSGSEPNGCAASPPQPLAVDYPSSSPWVIATGGIMVVSGDPVTTLGTTWLTTCGGAGGGVSSLFGAPPWQPQAVNRAQQAMRTVPDISSIAGDPGYELFGPGSAPPADWQWQQIDGDSMTGPYHAAAFAALRSALRAQGIEPPTVVGLMAVLYDPANYTRLFADVIEGQNTLFNDTCCFAGPGYDLTNGLGQLNVPELVQVLAEQAIRPVVIKPSFTG